MGWLSDTETKIRDRTNIASVNAKWTPTKIRGLLEEAFADIIPELFRNSNGPNSVRWSLTITGGTSTYARPPHVGEILQIARVDNNDNVLWRLRPRSRLNPIGPGVVFDGPVIKFSPIWRGGGTTLQVWYIPNGEISLAEGVLSGTHTTTSVEVTAAATGSLDYRENAYAGYVIQMGDANVTNVTEDRMVTASSWDGTNMTFTIEPALTFTPVDTDTFEIRPLLGAKLTRVVILHAAADILAYEGRADREAGVRRQLRETMRQLRLSASQLDQIVGTHFRSDTIDADMPSGGF